MVCYDVASVTFMEHTGPAEKQQTGLLEKRDIIAVPHQHKDRMLGGGAARPGNDFVQCMQCVWLMRSETD